MEIEFKNWQIEIVAPAPVGLEVIPQPNRNAQITWDPYSCDNADSRLPANCPLVSLGKRQCPLRVISRHYWHLSTTPHIKPIELSTGQKHYKV